VDIDEAVQHVDAGLRDRWLDLGIERQRATIAAVFERITIRAARTVWVRRPRSITFNRGVRAGPGLIR
jgi:hypothetical protein